MSSTIVIAGAVAGVATAGAWIAAPFVAMARRGTVDSRHRAEMAAAVAAETDREAAIRRARARNAAVAAASAAADVPAQRMGEHDALPQRSPIHY